MKEALLTGLLIGLAASAALTAYVHATGRADYGLPPSPMERILRLR